MFFVQSENIWKCVFSGSNGFQLHHAHLGDFHGDSKKKSCPRLKPPADLIFWATSGAVFGKKHGKHPQYDVCSSFWRWLCGAVFEATAEATWSDIQNNPILIPQADQIYPVPGEATIAPAGPGVSSLVRAPCPADWAGSWRCGVAFAREVKDFYWKNMWYNIYIYNMIIYLKVASTYLAKKKPKPSNYLLKWHHLCFRESEEKKLRKRSFKEFFSVFLSYSKKNRSRNQVVKASFRKLTFLQAFRW